MPTISPELLKRLRAKFGPVIDLTSDNSTLSDLLAEVLDGNGEFIVAGYDRTYDRSYERQDYDRNYQQYDKSYDTPGGGGYDKTYDRGYEKNGYDRNYQQYDKTT